MFLTLITVVIALILIYCYVKLKYFTLRGPLPGLPPQFIFGNMIQTGLLTRSQPLFKVLSQLQAQFGNVSQLWLGASRYIMVADANDVQHIFKYRQIYEQGDTQTEKLRLYLRDAYVCTKGEQYRRHTSCILPSFRRAKVIKNLDWIFECTDRILLDHWRSSKQSISHADIVQQSKRLSASMFTNIAFDYDLDLLADNALYEAIDTFFLFLSKLLFVPKSILKIYLKFSVKYQQAVNTIEHYASKILEEEQCKNQEIIDPRKETSLIASFVNALKKHEMNEADKPENEKRGLSQKETLNEIFFMLVSSYEIPSTSITWLIHLISKHPRVQAKMKAELSGNINQHMTIEQLDSLVYLDAVVREVLRLGPPFEYITRTVTADDRLPICQAQLYKGDEVIISLYNLARDTRYWKIDPELFYPERFLDDNADKNHHPYAYIPFGGGHRQCIAQDFAFLQLKAIAARLMQYVTFSDNGLDINSIDYQQKNLLTVVPHDASVTVSFD